MRARMRSRISVEPSLPAVEWRGCKPEICSLVLPESLSGDDWEVVGKALGSIKTGVQWWFGDWWAFGQHRYGDRKAIVEAEDWQGPSFSTCANAATVCRAFEETSRRREVLKFSHHAAVADLEEPEADALLNWAEETIAITGRPRSVRALSDEIWRRCNPETGPAKTNVRGPVQRFTMNVTTKTHRIIPLHTTIGETAPFRSFQVPAPDQQADDRVVRLVSTPDRQAIARMMDLAHHITATEPISKALRERLRQLRPFLESVAELAVRSTAVIPPASNDVPVGTPP